jgi:transcriptional regulator with XRE-family HTH domain
VNKRLKELRNTLGISQKEFAEKIGIGASAIAMLEKGTRNPSEQTIISICRDFNVSEPWLRSGEGEMFVEDDGTILSALVSEYGLDEMDQRILETFLKLPDDKRAAVKDFIVELARTIRAEESENAAEIAPPDLVDMTKPLSPSEHARILRKRADAIEKGSASFTTSVNDGVA